MQAYRAFLEQTHPAPWTFITKSAFDSAIANLSAMATSVSTNQLLVCWLQLNARLKDPHTRIDWIPGLMTPLIVYPFSEGYYITTTASSCSDLQNGQIIAVGGEPISLVAQKIATTIPDTCYGRTRLLVARELVNPILLNGLGITSSYSAITYTVKLQSGDTITRSVDAVNPLQSAGFAPHFSPNLMQVKHKGPVWSEYFDSLHAIYFSYQSCVNKDGQFEYELRELQKAIKKHKPNRIVIDMRYNSGGNSKLLRPFINFLAASYLNKPGGIWVLTGPCTFSSAVLNVGEIVEKTKAIVAGTPTGGQLDHFGEITFVKLSETGFTAYCSQKHFRHSGVGSVNPAVWLPISFANYLQKKDTAVFHALTQPAPALH